MRIKFCAVIGRASRIVLYCATQSACACQTANDNSVAEIEDLERYKSRELWHRFPCLDGTGLRRRDAVAVSQDAPNLHI